LDSTFCKHTIQKTQWRGESLNSTSGYASESMTEPKKPKVRCVTRKWKHLELAKVKY